MQLPLNDISEGYVIKDIEGLDPVKASLVTSPIAQTDGVQFQSSRRESRNIILKIGLGDLLYSTPVSELRKGLYDFFMPKSNVEIRFHMDGEEHSYILGMVESFVSPMFAREPEATVSILCFKPDFVSVEETLFEGLTTSDDSGESLMYDGSTNTGFIFTMGPIDRAVNNLTIYNQSAGDAAQSLQFSSPLEVGDILRISTVDGNKGAWLRQSSVEASILYGVSPTSTWVNLIPGTNDLQVRVDGDPIPYTIEYSARYGGL